MTKASKVKFERVQKYLNDTYQIHKNESISKDYFSCLLEEGKAKFSVVLYMSVVSKVEILTVTVDVILSSGASKKRAKQLQKEIQNA